MSDAAAAVGRLNEALTEALAEGRALLPDEVRADLARVMPSADDRARILAGDLSGLSQESRRYLGSVFFGIGSMGGVG